MKVLVVKNLGFEIVKTCSIHLKSINKLPTMVVYSHVYGPLHILKRCKFLLFEAILDLSRPQKSNIFEFKLDEA